MSWSLVQSNGADNTNGSGVASFAVAFTSPVTAGNLLVVGVGAFNAITGVSDSQGNRYGSIISAVGGANTFAGLFWTIAKSSGANTVTVTGSTFFPGVTLAEFAPPAGTVPAFDGGAIEGTTSSAGPATAAIPLTATDLIVGAIGADSNPTITAGSGFTSARSSAGGAGAEANCLIYWLNNSNATATPAWTLSTARQCEFVGAAFKAV